MNRKVVRTYIDRFIEENGPDGLLEYAKKSRVSSSTITKARIGLVPKKKCTRDKMAKPLGLTEAELFPILPDGEEQAS